MTTAYKRPILSGICDIIAMLLLIAGGFAIIAAVMGREFMGLGVGAMMIVAAIFYIGVGQAIGYLAKTAFHSQQTVAAIDQLAADLKNASRTAAPMSAWRVPSASSQKLIRVAKDGAEESLTVHQINQRKAAGLLSDADYYFDEHAGDWMTLDLLA